MVVRTDQLDAVIFDMDGVVTDTARVHARCWKDVFDDYLQVPIGAHRRVPSCRSPTTTTSSLSTESPAMTERPASSPRVGSTSHVADRPIRPAMIPFVPSPTSRT